MLSNKGQKAGVHVGTMTQHLSSLQPARRRFSRPRSLLPPKHEFYFKVQSRATGWGWGRGRAANGGYSPLPSSLLPLLSLGARSRQWSLSGAVSQGPTGHSAPSQGLVAEAVSGVAGLGASRAGAPALASVGRGVQTGAISRATRGSGGGGRCAPGGRWEGGGGAGGRGGRLPRSKPLPVWTPLAGRPRLPAQLAPTPRHNRGGRWPAGTRPRPTARPRVLFLLPPAREPVAKGHGAGLGFDVDRPLRRPGSDPQLHTRASAPRSGSQPPFVSRARSAGSFFVPTLGVRPSREPPTPGSGRPGHALQPGPLEAEVGGWGLGRFCGPSPRPRGRRAPR